MWVMILCTEISKIGGSKYRQDLFVPPAEAKKTNITIHLDMTIAYPCQMIRVALRDFSGNHEFDFKRKLTRQRMSPELKPFAPPLDDMNPRSPHSQCNSCYGGKKDCCLTCQDVIAAFTLANKMVPNLDGIAQCQRDRMTIDDRETCKLIGELTTDLERGEIVIQSGGDTKLPMDYKADLSLFGDSINMSHWIHQLSFGEPAGTSTLDGAHWQQREYGYFQYNYRAHLVHTLRENSTNGYQYSAQFNHKKIEKSVTKRRPGISIRFEKSPYSVKIVTERISLGSVLTRLLAVIGGCFALAGAIDSLLFGLSHV